MKKNTFKVLFYIRGNRINKDGNVSVMIRITVDGEMEQLNSKLVVNPEIWDAKTGRAIGRSAKVLELNSHLNDIQVILKEHYDLVKFQKGQNPIEAFLSNFVRQCQNPSRFGFFRVQADRYDTVGTVIGDLAKDPEANAEMLKNNKVELPTAEQKVEQPTQTATPTEQPAQTESTVEPSAQTADESQAQTTISQEPKWQAIDQSKIDWDTLKEKWGIDKEALEASGDLKEMLYNRKSKPVKITPTLGGEKFNIEARLSFRTDPDGSVKLVPYFIQSEQKLDEFMGYKFDKIDQANLKENGNLGRIVELTDPVTGEKVPSLISRDRYTNELLAIPAKDVKIRDTFGQTKLTMPEIITLKKGLLLPPKEVVCRDGKTRTGILQYNVDRKAVEFVPNGMHWYEKIEQAKQGAKGIPLSIISEGMGHDSEATSQIYLASLDTSVVDRANSLILKCL